MSNTSLKTSVSSILFELFANHTMHEIFNDSDCISSLIHSSADSLCTYTNECMDMVSELETEYGLQVEESGEFKNHEWCDAVRSYAIDLCTVALESMVHEELQETREAIELFNAKCEELDCPDVDKAHIGDCAYGWEAHNYETIEGVMVWNDEPGFYNPRLLEGELVAVSHPLPSGQYINVCWTPEAE